MNIGIIGAGRIGANAAALFAKAGYNVTISHSGDPQTLAELATQLGPNVTARTSADTVRYAQLILLAIPWPRRQDLPEAFLFEGKVVIDATNPYENGNYVKLDPSTSSEEILKLIPGARLVKAFNTIHYETLRTGSKSTPKDRLVIFMAGDETESKEIVAHLIEKIGFAAVDLGFLHQGGRRMEPDSPIYNVPLTVAEARKKMEQLP